jgi:hypothetical protein
VPHPEEAGLLLPKAVALPADIDDVTVVEQAVKTGGADHGIAADGTPLSGALVGGQNDAPALIPDEDEGEQGRGRQTVIGLDAELIDDGNLRRDVHPHPREPQREQYRGGEMLDVIATAIVQV